MDTKITYKCIKTRGGGFFSTNVVFSECINVKRAPFMCTQGEISLQRVGHFLGVCFEYRVSQSAKCDKIGFLFFIKSSTMIWYSYLVPSVSQSMHSSTLAFELAKHGLKPMCTYGWVIVLQLVYILWYK